MTVEEQKAALDNISKEINQKLDSATAGIQKGEKASNDLKKELEVLLDQHKNLNDQVTGDLDKANDRIDSLETSLQKMDSQRGPENFESKMQKAFQESFDAKGRVQGTFELTGLDTKAIMLESTNLVNDVIQPQRVGGGIIGPDERMRHIRPYIAPGNTTSSSVDYVEETAYTDNMDSVAEGASLGQSDLTLTQQTSVVKKVGSYATISREMLEDVAGLMSYVQGRLLAKYWQREDTELLFGDGTGTNLLGVGTNAVAWADPGVVANATEFDVLRAAILQAQQDEYMPNLIVLNPAELFKMDVAKDGNGQYYLPFIFSGGQTNISGVPIVATTAIAPDNFLVGDFARGAQIFDRRSITLEVASEHSDDWVKDLMSVKLTTRLALPIYRQGVFVSGVMSTSKTALGS